MPLGGRKKDNGVKLIRMHPILWNMKLKKSYSIIVSMHLDSDQLRCKMLEQ